MRELFYESGLAIENGKLIIPTGIRRVKIDIGLSVNAPQSQIWILQDPELFVLGFEPLSTNIDEIKSNSSKWANKLSSKFIGSRIALIRSALYSKHIPEGMDMYVTKNDPGCSSLLEPKTFEVDHVETVSVWTLNDALDYFPFDRIPIIDHLKIDAQGSDFEILIGASRWIDKFFAVTVEVDISEYKSSTNSQNNLDALMVKNNFIRYKPGIITDVLFLIKGYKIDVETDDPTYINLGAIKASRSRRFFLYQRG